MTWLDKVRNAQSTLEALMRDNKDEMDTEAALAFRSFIELTQAVEAIGRHVGCPLVDLDSSRGTRSSGRARCCEGCTNLLYQFDAASHPAGRLPGLVQGLVQGRLVQKKSRG